MDEYISENIFYVPEAARWSVIANAAHTPEIGAVIDEAMRAIEADNAKQLKDTLLKFSDIIKPLLVSTNYRQKEYEKLLQLRDNLLPKLMSGAIHV